MRSRAVAWLATVTVGLASGTLSRVEVNSGVLSCEDVGTRTRQCISVPFAAPPVGSLRWKPPQPPTAWEGVRDASATAIKPLCLQGNKAPVAGGTDEDCLYLNIYAPRALNQSTKYAVVVWIHGGSYETGSPENATGLVDFAGDIIYVGMNYRMGWSGYLGGAQLRPLDPTGSTGNLGSQDQRMAMQWVKENIGALGGDPTRVTIDGCSAGAGSVAAHIVSSKSWPFFTQASGQSGVTSAWNSLPMAEAQHFYDLFAEAAGCGVDAAGVGCLQQLSTIELAAAATAAWKVRTSQSNFTGTNNYAPVIDGVELTATPRDLVHAGHSFSGPVLLGTAADEVCSLEGMDFSWGLTEEAFKADVISEYGAYNISLDQVMALYGNSATPFHGQPNASCGCGSPQLSPDVCLPCTGSARFSAWWWSAIERGSDFGFHCPTRDFSRRFTKNDVFMYTYKVLGEQFKGLYCVAHCTEIHNLFFTTQPDTTSPQGRLTRVMASYWASFYRTGNPNTDADTADGAIQWPAYGVKGESVAFSLPDAGGIYLETDYRKPECDYWATLPSGPDLV